MDRRRFGQLTALFALGASLPRMALAGEWEAVLAEAQGHITTADLLADLDNAGGLADAAMADDALRVMAVQLFRHFEARQSGIFRSH